MKQPQIKAGQLVRITSRKTKLQPNVKQGEVYAVKAVESTPTGATVLVLHNTQAKSKTMRVNSDRFGWELVTFERLAQEKKQRDFRQEVKTDVQRILNAFTFEEHVQITFVPLVLNEIAWHYAYRAMQVSKQERIQDLRKLSRVLKELHKTYERTVCQDLLPSDLTRIQRQTEEFMQENAYHFQIMYYTASNIFTKQYGKVQFEDMRIYAILAMLVIQYIDQHNKRCDEMLAQRLGKIKAAKRMPAIDSLYSGMDAFTGELPAPFNFNDPNLQMCLGILRNNLLKCQWVIDRNK